MNQLKPANSRFRENETPQLYSINAMNDKDSSSSHQSLESIDPGDLSPCNLQDNEDLFEDDKELLETELNKNFSVQTLKRFLKNLSADGNEYV